MNNITSLPVIFLEFLTYDDEVANKCCPRHWCIHQGLTARDRMARGIGQLETGPGEHLPLQPLDPNTQSRRAWIASCFLDINYSTGLIALA